MNKKKKILSSLFLGLGTLTFAGLAIGVINFESNVTDAYLNDRNTSEYQLTLNSDNKVTSAGDHKQHTKRGSEVTFTYTNVASSTSGHVNLNANGSVVNKDIIHSITSFTASFSGTGSLQARISYTADSSKWSDYFTVISGQEVDTSATKPYFLEFKAINGSITVTSATYLFDCTVNQDAEEVDTEGTYDITFNKADKDSSTSFTDTTAKAAITSGSEYISSFETITKVFDGTGGYKFGSSKSGGDITINLNTSNVKEPAKNIDFYPSQYGSEDCTFTVYLNGSSFAAATFKSTASKGVVAYNGILSSLRVTSTTRGYISGITINYGSKTEPGTPDAPLFVTGFTADDTNKNSYTTNSVFAQENALSVKKTMSDGSQVSTTEYTYVIKNALDETINPAEPFPAEGTYTLTVSYGNYIPVDIHLNVGEYVYVSDVTAAMETIVFNTADTLSAHLEGNLTATIEYSNDTISSSIAYSEFASHGIGMSLATPKGITHDINNPFGTAGTWTVKVFSLTDENIQYAISITVNAIEVSNITLNESSKELTVGDQLQLVATVGPNNATNQNVVWTSNNAEVASVDENGLVVANAVGGAKITATAADGSGVYGECTLTVVAAPVIVSGDAEMVAGSNASSCTVNEHDGIKVGTGKAGGDMTITIPAGAQKVSFYCAGWNGSSGAVSLTRTSGTISSSSISPTANTGISNNSPFTLSSGSNEEDYKFEITLSEVNSETDLTLSRDSRFVIWGAKYYINSTPVDPVYPTAISLSAASNSITIGATTQLTVGYTPSDTNVKNVTYSSSNESVATVSSTGLVTGVTQGSVTITATAEAANNTTKTATTSITITPVSVTSVSLDTNSTTVKVGKTVTLIATVSPSSATNKNINWSSGNTSVATVSGGVVTGVAAGTATITATSAADSSKKATCTVSVQASGGEETFSISYTDLPTTYKTDSTVYTADSGIKFQAYNCANYSKKMQFKASSGYIQSTEDLELQSITINDRESNTLTVYGSNTAGSFSTTITGNNDVYDLTGYSYFKIARTDSGAAYCSSITVTTGTPTPTDPTAIVLSPTSAEIMAGGSKQLSVSYVPSNANQNKEITWTSSNTNVATVSSDGLVSVKPTASVGQTATITARLTNITSITATCLVTVVEQKIDDHTVLIYMCGADLESESQLATGDITEILKVSGQPDDVNIVLETGGASSWASTYGISSSKLERYHVKNKSLVRDDQLTYASMGLTSTLQSFIEYGLNNFPAERTGLVFWNHGGGMRGVCYDEKKNDDVLKNSEIKSAVSGALSNCGKSGQKLEWVGYDACLMAVQDIAETNSRYFNYMIASEESEAGYGWDYDNWVDDLYAKKTTTTILKAIVDSFISDNGGANSSSGDQTLSYLNLSYASAYKTAWENMASQLNNVVTSSNKSSFNSAITSNVKHYADSDYDYFCTFDAWDFVDKLANNNAFSSFRIDSSYTTAVKNAHANLVAYNLAQKGAGVSKGLCMYWPNSSRYSDVSTYYTTSETNFTVWRSFCVNKGIHA